MKPVGPAGAPSFSPATPARVRCFARRARYFAHRARYFAQPARYFAQPARYFAHPTRYFAHPTRPGPRAPIAAGAMSCGASV